MRNSMQGLFILAGIASMIAGLNNGRPLVIVGAGLIVLGICGRILGRKPAQACIDAR